MPISDQSLRVILSLKDELSKKLKSAEGAVDSFTKKANKAKSASLAFAGGLVVVGGGIAFLGKSAIDAAGQFEQSQIAFTTMLGSAEESAKLLSDLADFARKTPFELVGIEASAKQLLAMGIESNKLLPTLKALGDVSAGLSVPIGRLALNFGQVKAQSKLTGRELRDFAIAGVPLLAELSKQLGVSTEVIQDMVSAGEIGFDAVEQAFVSMTSEGGKFENLMIKQSLSFQGMVENLRDAWQMFLREQGAELLIWAKKFVNALIIIVDEKLPRWIGIIKELVNWFKENKVALMIVVGAILGALVPAVFLAIKAFLLMAVALAPFILGGMIIGGLVAGFLWLRDNWEEVVEFFKLSWEALKMVFKESVNIVKMVINNWINEQRLRIFKVWNNIKEFFAGIWDDIIGIFRKAIDWIINKINTVMGAINRVRSTISSIGGAIGNILPRFDKGGIVPGPIGAPMPAIVHGGERIIPVGGKGGGGITINITGNTLLDEEVAEKIGDMIINVLGIQKRFVT